MLKTKRNKIIGSVLNFIDNKTDGAISNLHKTRYIDNLEEYLLYGYVAFRQTSKYLKPLIDIDRSVRLSSVSNLYNSRVDHSIGFAMPERVYRAIYEGVYKRSSLLKHLDIVETDSDRVTVAFNNVQHLRWPGEMPLYREEDPEPKYIEVNNNVALLSFLFSSKRDITRAKSLEQDYIESNIETLVEYFDRAILYGEISPAKISGLYPRYKDEAPDYSYIHQIDTFDSEYLTTLKNSLPVKYRDEASWIMSKDTGRLIADDMEMPKDAELPISILGIPVIYNDYMDSVDTRDGVPVILANLNKAYTFTQGIKGKAASVRRFNEDIRSEKEQLLALTRYRWGGKLTNPEALRVLRIENFASQTGIKPNNSENVYSNLTEIKEKLETI